MVSRTTEQKALKSNKADMVVNGRGPVGGSGVSGGKGNEVVWERAGLSAPPSKNKKIKSEPSPSVDPRPPTKKTQPMETHTRSCFDTTHKGTKTRKGKGKTERIFSLSQKSSSESHPGPPSSSAPSNWVGSTAYRSNPPMPPNPRQNWDPSWDRLVTNSMAHPNFL